MRPQGIGIPTTLMRWVTKKKLLYQIQANRLVSNMSVETEPTEQRSMSAMSAQQTGEERASERIFEVSPCRSPPTAQTLTTPLLTTLELPTATTAQLNTFYDIGEHAAPFFTIRHVLRPFTFSLPSSPERVAAFLPPGQD